MGDGLNPAERRKRATLAELIEKARDHVMTPAEVQAQRKNWVCGEMLLRYPTMSYDQAAAIYDQADPPRAPAEEPDRLRAALRKIAQWQFSNMEEVAEFAAAELAAAEAAEADIAERVARRMRRRFNVANFDRDDDTGWQADLDDARAAIDAVDAARGQARGMVPRASYDAGMPGGSIDTGSVTVGGHPAKWDEATGHWVPVRGKP